MSTPVEITIAKDQAKKIAGLLTDLMNQNAVVGSDDTVVGVTDQNWHAARDIRTQVYVLLSDLDKIGQVP